MQGGSVQNTAEDEGMEEVRRSEELKERPRGPQGE